MEQILGGYSNVMFILDKADIYSACFRPKEIKTYERYSCFQQNVFTRFIFRILFRFEKLRPRLFSHELTDCGENSILAFDTVGKEFIRWLRENNTNNRIVIFFINTVRNVELVDFYKSMNCELWSFDPVDCKKYDMNFNDWYCTFETDRSITKKYDVVFVGREKTRRPILDKFEHYLKQNNMAYYFHVTHEKNYPIVNPLKYKHQIPYKKMISIERKSKAMIEIVEPGQNGSTLRIMDSVFNNVKLITNFDQIKGSPFYRPENIYVFDELLSFEDMSAFINTPFQEYDEELLQEYRFEKWISRFHF